ncbi:MAG: MFS transporter [Candidatus Marinimicrobia bacterium]|nr:MFS transporter [Candidatus Neomarinimicrobiota bacterium]
MGLIKDKGQFGWVMYDWANSAFATTVMAGFFPVFFKNYWSSTSDVNMSTAYLGMANSLASLMVALLAPILGAISDQGKSRKQFLVFFAFMSILMTGCLFMVEMGNWQLALFLYVMGTIGFSGGNIFYDSLLPDVATEKTIDFISSKGYAYGYLGGGLLFLINVLWYTMPASFGFETEYSSRVIDQSNNTIFVEAEKFNVPESGGFEAIVTSYYYADIQKIEIERQGNETVAHISIDGPQDLDWERINKTVGLGQYKTAEFVGYDPSHSVMTVKNLTRKITKNDAVTMKIDNPIIVGNYQNGICSEIFGLEKTYEDITIKSNILEPAHEFLPVRLSFLSVALWWGIFTIPLILWVKEEKNRVKNKVFNYVKLGFGQLASTFKKVRKMKYIFMFLGAYWMYIDGVNTVIRMSVDYGMSIGLPSSSLIVALLITQFVGFPSALIFGKLGEKWSVKNSLFIGIIIYLGINVWAIFMKSAQEFYLMAIIIGTVQGGIQALSRSMYSRLVPRGQNAEFFGFFNMTGKFAAIFGPLLVGLINIIARNFGLSSDLSTRIGIGSLILLFIGGGIFLYFVDVDEGKRQASEL